MNNLNLIKKCTKTQKLMQELYKEGVIAVYPEYIQMRYDIFKELFTDNSKNKVEEQESDGIHYLRHSTQFAGTEFISLEIV